MLLLIYPGVIILIKVGVMQKDEFNKDLFAYFSKVFIIDILLLLYIVVTDFYEVEIILYNKFNEDWYRWILYEILTFHTRLRYANAYK